MGVEVLEEKVSGEGVVSLYSILFYFGYVCVYACVIKFRVSPN